MSVYAAAPMASDWPSYRLGSRSTTDLGGSQEEIGLGLGFGRIQTSTVERPSLRTHKSFPHNIGTSGSYSTPHCQSPLSQVANPGTSHDEFQSSFGGLPRPVEPKTEAAAEQTFPASAPQSPLPQLTPTSAEAEHEPEEQIAEDEDMLVVGDDEDDTPSGSAVEKTAAERRAEKRKMKRFRPTHNQTRFLMSEFARQAHPDAAQRERLSREIPGLSPRQVQVWFQNRRAKLKRLTTDDRERMMKSRALPEDFDMTQALHSPFGATMSQPFSQPYSTPIASPASYASTFNDTGMIRPLMINGLRRESDDENTISPISISSQFSSFYTPPGSIPNSENLSPISPVGERAPFMNHSYSQNNSPRSNPFSRSSSFGANFPHPHIPRLQLHDRVTRTRADSLGSPLRSSMSYTGNLDFASPTSEESMPGSGSSILQPSRSYSTDTSGMSRPGGFSYLPQGPPGFQSSALARPRINNTTFPPGLDLSSRTSNYRTILPFSVIGQQHQQQPQHHSPTSQPHPLTPSHVQHQQAPTSHHAQQPASPHHSNMAYGSASQPSNQDFHLPNTNDVYGVSYPDAENDTNNMGLNANANTGSIPEHPLEPESYYKSEPGNRRFSTAHSTHSTHSQQHYSPSLPPQTQQSQPQQPQHYSPSLQPQHSAGLKRSRDGSEGSQGENSGLAPELGGGRRRSFTVPSGYGAGVSS